jgi:trehalose-6-phosphate synthase
MSLPQRLAFFAASDIFMATAARYASFYQQNHSFYLFSCFCFHFRDGLNRTPMEYTLAKQRVGQLCLQNPEGNPLTDTSYKGLVILSEFISSARVMRGSLTINPWNIREVLNVCLLLANKLECN